jgi:DNA helicase II / ATP-dependent DNA helicase PcrA
MSNTPPCPTCGAATIARTGKFGRFWACTRFPACRGGMDYFEYTPEMDVTQEPAWQKAKRRLGDHVVPVTSKAEVPQKALEVKSKSGKKTKKQLADLAATIAAAKRAGVNVVEKSNFKPSPFQQAIFDWVDRSNDRQVQNVNSLMVEALAGSGKTTTAVAMMQHIPLDQKVVFSAFNVHIKDVLAKKAPRHALVATCHGLGLKACVNGLGPVEVDKDGYKVQGYLENALDKETQRDLYPAVRQLVMLVKATLCSTDDADLENLENRYGIEVNNSQDKIHAAVRYIVARCSADTKRVDFDDMIWLPVALGLPVPQFDDVIVDEFQDMNKAQRALLMMSVRDNGRVIGVGDRFQSMYGFRGADTESISSFISEFQADVLPLSITYRNPKSVVRLINERFPEIPLQAAEWAKDGTIENIMLNKADGMWKDADMVLCRTNAPLVKPAFGLIRRGIKAIIRGRDIGSGLISMIKKMECNTTTELLTKLEKYRMEEVQKLMNSNKTTQAQALADKCETIGALCDGVDQISDIYAKIDHIFSDTNAGVVFSSVHRAKGLEAERVFILKPELMPHPMAKQTWEQSQERNIEYVALSRTLDQLYFVAED